MRDDETPEAGRAEARDLIGALGIPEAGLVEGAYLDLLNATAARK